MKSKKRKQYSDYKFQTGFFDSKKNGKKIKFRSSYELEIFKILEKDKDILYFEYEPFGIIYSYHSKIKRYYPDLLVHYKNKIKKLIEIKAKWMMNNPSYYLQRKLTAAYAFSRRHNYIFEIWTWDEEQKKIIILKLKNNKN